MVHIFQNELVNNLSLIDSLTKVSDGLCVDDTKKCIDFDKFPSYCLQVCNVSQNQPATVDALILNFNHNHTLFVEFKDLRSVKDPKHWLTKKRLQQIYLKVHESFHMLARYVVQKSLATYDDFYHHKKSVFIVYDVRNKRSIFHNHFKGKVNRLQYLVEQMQVINCQAFMNFIQKEGLC